MAIRTILPQGMKTEEDDVPKKFTNIDTVDFDFRWNSKWKRVQAGWTVIMPKYLVNYAAYHLARKMFKRDSLKAWEETPPSKQKSGFPTIRDDVSEIKLQLKMVVKNPGIRHEFVDSLENKKDIEVLSGVAPEALDNATEPGAKQLSKEGENIPALPAGEEIEVLEKVEEKEIPPVVKKPEESKEGEAPPAEPIGSGKVETPKEGGFPCSECEFIAKSEFGLKSHMRTHKKPEGATQ